MSCHLETIGEQRTYHQAVLIFRRIACRPRFNVVSVRRNPLRQTSDLFPLVFRGPPEFLCKLNIAPQRDVSPKKASGRSIPVLPPLVICAVEALPITLHNTLLTSPRFGDERRPFHPHLLTSS